LAIWRTRSTKQGKPLPGVAQVAIQGGVYAAKVIRARLEGKQAPPPFHYLNKRRGWP